MIESRRSVLFVSNGHGEDLIGARLAKELAELAPELSIRALPIVGVGSAYAAANIPLIMGGRNLPSGGFVRNGLPNLLIDLRAGLLSLTRQQIKMLRTARATTDLAVCVGDTYLNLLVGNFLRRPIIFLPTAKSDYVDPHWPVEIRLMRAFCVKVFPRDELTAQSLRAHGLPAEFAGNIMMDSLEYKGSDLGRTGEEWVIGVLPGSRPEAYENLEDIADAALEFARSSTARGSARPARYLVALAGGLSFDDAAARLTAKGWTRVPAEAGEDSRGVQGHLELAVAGATIRFTVAKGRFADILAASDAVLGLAGTANEQAVGLGVPVVTFVGRGPQFTPKFLRTQKKLLGEAIRVSSRDPQDVAAELWRVLTDEELRETMAKTGRARMGEPGGAARIAAEIRRLVEI